MQQPVAEPVVVRRLGAVKSLQALGVRSAPGLPAEKLPENARITRQRAHARTSAM